MDGYTTELLLLTLLDAALLGAWIVTALFLFWFLKRRSGLLAQVEDLEAALERQLRMAAEVRRSIRGDVSAVKTDACGIDKAHGCEIKP